MKTIPLLITAAVLAGPALADVTVNFRNNVLPNLSSRLVTYSPLFGALSGTPVVNGVPAGASYVAQLFLVDDQHRLTPIGGVTNFRSVPQTDPLAGTWSGANRTIPGLPSDAVVNLAVRVWDNLFGSFEAACAGGAVAGQSAVFSYQNALSSPPATTDTYMLNFYGFEIGGLADPCVPEPHTYALLALGLGGLWFWRPRK